MQGAKTGGILTCVLLAMAGISNADTLEKRHRLGIRVGVWNQTADVRTEIAPGSVTTSVGSSGFLGGVSYGYGLTESLALNFDLGAMALDVSTKTATSGVSTNTSTIALMRVGIKQYFPASSYGGSARPFIKTGLGVFVGTQSGTSVRTTTTITVEERTESAFGGLLGGGADFIFGKHIMGEVLVGYDWMTDFEKPIGGSENYSGPVLSFGLSYLFGSDNRLGEER